MKRVLCSAWLVVSGYAFAGSPASSIPPLPLLPGLAAGPSSSVESAAAVPLKPLPRVRDGA